MLAGQSSSAIRRSGRSKRRRMSRGPRCSRLRSRSAIRSPAPGATLTPLVAAHPVSLGAQRVAVHEARILHLTTGNLHGGVAMMRTSAVSVGDAVADQCEATAAKLRAHAVRQLAACDPD